MFNKWVPTEKIFFHPKAIIGLPQNLFLGVRRHENYSHRGKLALKWGKIVWTARISVQMFSTIITGLKQTPSNAKKMLLKNPFLLLYGVTCPSIRYSRVCRIWHAIEYVLKKRLNTQNRPTLVFMLFTTPFFGKNSF